MALERTEFTSFLNFISVSSNKHPLTQTQNPHCFDKASWRKYSAIFLSLLVLIQINTLDQEKKCRETPNYDLSKLKQSTQITATKTPEALVTKTPNNRRRKRSKETEEEDKRASFNGELKRKEEEEAKKEEEKEEKEKREMAKEKAKIKKDKMKQKRTTELKKAGNMADSSAMEVNHDTAKDNSTSKSEPAPKKAKEPTNLVSRQPKQHHLHFISHISSEIDSY